MVYYLGFSSLGGIYIQICFPIYISYIFIDNEDQGPGTAYLDLVIFPIIFTNILMATRLASNLMLQISSRKHMIFLFSALMLVYISRGGFPGGVFPGGDFLGGFPREMMIWTPELRFLRLGTAILLRISRRIQWK